MLVPSTETLSSLPIQCNWSTSIICLGVPTSHPVFTLWPSHILMDTNVLHNFSILLPPAKTNKVFLSPSLCTTIGSTVVCSYTNPTIMSGFINTGDNACPLCNSNVKTTALLLLSLFGIGCKLSVDDVDIATTSKFKL